MNVNAETETIKGVIENVVYHNENNDYTVLEIVDANNDLVVADGNYGIVVTLEGKDENDENILNRNYVFNCSDFFGNPYNFTAPAT